MSAGANQRTLYLVHHHLRRGGVTRVMFSAAEILRDAGEQVCLLSGEPPPEAVPEGVGCKVIPALAYSETAGDAGELFETLSGLYREGDIWHLHNHSLGKNPAVTDVFCRLAERGHLMLLQPHDFAEDGRPQNLNRLRTQFPGFPDRLYPFGPHVQYAVLQQRDHDLLKSAGIPEAYIHLLPNPISSGERFAPPQHPPRRLVYLTRAIRRKNVGEFLYWAACLKGEIECATSLIPENPAELALFKTWQDFAEEEEIPVRWGIGQTRSFREVVEESDACITTSVGEGFGMSFLEPYGMGRGVLGRNLPEITAGFSADGIDLSALYTELPVPVESVDGEFWPRALHQIREWRKSMGVQDPVKVPDLISAWVQEGQIDFGRLDEPAQRQVLRNLKGRMNSDLLAPAQNQPVLENARKMESVYGPVPYLKRLQSIYAALKSPVPLERADGNRIRDAFLDLKTVRLLRT